MRRGRQGGGAPHLTGALSELRLLVHCREELKKVHYDYFVFGHRHLPIDFLLNPGAEMPSRYINLGDWIQYFSYLEFDGQKAELKYYRS